MNTIQKVANVRVKGRKRVPVAVRTQAEAALVLAVWKLEDTVDVLTKQIRVLAAETDKAKGRRHD
jgi:hypothetical protein